MKDNSQLITGLGVFMWARSHSPNVNFGEAFMEGIANPNAYFLNTTLYNVILLFCALLGIIGVIVIVFGIQEKLKRN